MFCYAVLSVLMLWCYSLLESSTNRNLPIGKLPLFHKVVFFYGIAKYLSVWSQNHIKVLNGLLFP